MSEDKLNRLPPALRQKERYLKFKIHSEGKIELGEVVDAIWEKSISYLGTKETSEADFWVIGNQFNEEKQVGIVKVNRDKIDDFRAALALVNNIAGGKGFLQVKKVSGSIKKLKDD